MKDRAARKEEQRKKRTRLDVDIPRTRLWMRDSYSTEEKFRVVDGLPFFTPDGLGLARYEDDGETDGRFRQKRRTA